MLRSLRLCLATALLMSVALSSSTRAQGFGVKAGLGFTGLRGGNAGISVFDPDTHRVIGVLDDKSTRTGLVLGVFAYWSLADNLVFQPELLYAQKGAKFADPEVRDAAVARVRLHVIDFPLLVRYGLAGESLSPFVIAGPRVGIKLDSSVDLEIPGGGPTFANLSTNSLDWGLVFGGGVDVGKFVFDIRFELGLSDATKAPRDAQNGGLVLSAGYRF